MKLFKNSIKKKSDSAACCVCNRSHQFSTGRRFKYADDWYKFCGKSSCIKIYQICKMYIIKPSDAINLQERKQQKICECCGISVETDTPEFDLVIEHCHTTWHVRGVTCKSCNSIIGKLESDTYKNENVKAIQHHYDWIARTADLEVSMAVKSYLAYLDSVQTPKETISIAALDKKKQQADDDRFWAEFSKPYKPNPEERKRSDLSAEDLLLEIYRKRD